MGSATGFAERSSHCRRHRRTKGPGPKPRNRVAPGRGCGKRRHDDGTQISRGDAQRAQVRQARVPRATGQYLGRVGGIAVQDVRDDGTDLIRAAPVVRRWFIARTEPRGAPQTDACPPRSALQSPRPCHAPHQTSRIPNPSAKSGAFAASPRFIMPGVKQACPTAAACWSPSTPGIAISRPNRSALAVPKAAAQARAQGRMAIGTAGRPQILASQTPDPMLQSSVRAALVASVACTCLPVSFQIGKGLNGAKGHPPLLHTDTGTGHVINHPFHLDRTEIRVQQKAHLRRNHRFIPSRFQRITGVGGASILSDNRIVNGLIHRSVPDKGGIARMGDADGCDLPGIAPAS